MSGWQNQSTQEGSSTREPSMTNTHRGKLCSETSRENSATILCNSPLFYFSLREVLAELSKIERFNAIITNQPPWSSSMQHISGCGLLIGGCGQLEAPSFVQDALHRTETIVQDIDTILGK